MALLPPIPKEMTFFHLLLSCFVVGMVVEEAMPLVASLFFLFDFLIGIVGSEALRFIVVKGGGPAMPAVAPLPTLGGALYLNLVKICSDKVSTDLTINR